MALERVEYDLLFSVRHTDSPTVTILGQYQTTAVGTPAVDQQLGFFLSTGDQCGRDTPDENLYAMIETARTYGKY